MIIEKIKAAIINLRKNQPVVLNLTNFVTMDFVANCLLAIGTAPIMSIYEEELAELVALSSAIYINIGTLDAAFIKRISKTVELAKKYDKAIVLDPVGAGATKIRTETSKQLAPYTSIIRGNASEIMALGDFFNNTKGVESVNTPQEAKEVAKSLTLLYQTTIIVSGEVDFITDGRDTSEVPYGSGLMPKITGIGCALTAVICAFKAVIEDPLEASIVGAHYFALCGEITEQTAKHPGAFKNNFIDQLHAADFISMRNIQQTKLIK